MQAPGTVGTGDIQIQTWFSSTVPVWVHAKGNGSNLSSQVPPAAHILGVSRWWNQFFADLEHQAIDVDLKHL